MIVLSVWIKSALKVVGQVWGLVVVVKVVVVEVVVVAIVVEVVVELVVELVVVEAVQWRNKVKNSSYALLVFSQILNS